MLQPDSSFETPQPRSTRLRFPKFRRLRTQLTVYFLGLFAIALGGIVAAVYVSVERNAERVVSQELTAGAVVFDRIWQLRAAELENSAALQSRDFGFRAAVATHDSATIRSALDNLRRRVKLHLAFVVGADGRVLASQDRYAADISPAQFGDDADGEERSGIILLPDGPYEAVATPILAPIPIGQVIFAVRLDQSELASLVRLSPIEFEPHVLVQDSAGQWRSGANGLSSAELVHAAAALARGGATQAQAARIGPWEEVVRPLPSLGGNRAALVLRYRLAAALAPYRGLLALVLLLGLAGLMLVAAAGWMLARAVTRPIAALKSAAERLERGESSAVELEGRDEIAALGATFNRMADGIWRREQALEVARDDAEAANRAKSEFLANMSHEIRTPLNGILGMAQVIAREPLDATQQERLAVIRRSGEALLGILNGVLDLSKIEAGKIELEIQNFDLAAAVRAACEPFAALAAEKGVAFDILIDRSADQTWRGDELRLRQVLSNLASNAVKFTEAGRITLKVNAEAGGVSFEMSDSGMGIPRDQLDQIFDKFAQADGSSTRRFGGTGLGLAICRELVSLMGGRMGVDSEPDRGSVFRFDLPLTRADPPERLGSDIVAPETMATALRVLAAEDNETNRLILAAFMKASGVELSFACDGAEAVEAFRREPFDLLLMDIQMPKMSGVEATIAIRNLEAEERRRPTPILAVTANVMNDQVEEYLAAGMNGVVAKPIQAETLFGEMERALSAPMMAETSDDSAAA